MWDKGEEGRYHCYEVRTSLLGRPGQSSANETYEWEILHHGWDNLSWPM